MARRDRSDQSAIASGELLRQLEEAAASATPAELLQAMQHLLGAGAGQLDPLGREPPPSRRRPRRSDVVTYRVRVDLDGTKPPLWRRLELASDLRLDEVHDILQAAFGWTDSHLHRFGSGPDHYSRDTEHYLCPWEVEDGEAVGIPEEQVRLDEVLVDVGDRLLYTYDYGDDWLHTIRLEAVEDRADDAPRAVCIKARRPGPPEDCGGVHGYEMVAAAVDPAHPDHADAVAELEQLYGGEVGPGDYDLMPADIDQINAALADLGIDTPAPTDVPEPLAELLADVSFAPDRQWLRTLIAEAGLDEPVHVDGDVAARMVAPYTWLLDRVGDEGIKLTAAGYLPPGHVEAAFDALGLADEWIGKGNREDQTLPVLHLRESAQQAGLLRKHRGRLVLTARGRTARTDPVALWWQLAERMPLRTSDEAERQAGLAMLVAIAAEATEDLDAAVARVLGSIGWIGGDGSPFSDRHASHASWNTRMTLVRLGALVGDGWRDRRPTPDGVTFARAALRTWPS